MINNDLIKEAARRLREAEFKKEVCAPLREILGTEDLSAAYAVQQYNAKLRRAAGAKVVGHKIGLTSLAVQEQFGIDQPDYGLLWNDKEVNNGGEVSMSELMQAKAESEIAFVLSKDLNSDCLSMVDIIQSIDFALCSIEIVGSRIKNWDISITDTIADNASASHWLVAHKPVKLNDFDVVNCKMIMKKNGQIESEGFGKSCIGSPLNAVLWLAKKMVEMGKPLKQGDLVLSGALGPMVAVEAGDFIEVEIEGLGGASVSFVE